MIRLQDLILLCHRSDHCRFFPQRRGQLTWLESCFEQGTPHCAHSPRKARKIRYKKISCPLWNIKKYLNFYLHDVFPSKPLHIDNRHNARYLGKHLLQVCSSELSEGFQWNDFLPNLEILWVFPPGFSALLQSARGTSGWCWSAKEVKRGIIVQWF